jgi:hypothetical protein
MKTITIDCFRHESEGRSCGRCEDSYRTIEKAVEKISDTLRERDICIDLRELTLDDSRMEQSNSVFINGKDVTMILNEREGIFSYCRSCTESSGRPTECRTFIYRSRAYESIPEEMVIEALLREAVS